MRPAEAADRARRAAGRLLPAPARARGAKVLAAIGAPRWALPEWEYVADAWPAADDVRTGIGWEGKAVSDAYRRKRAEVLEALRETGPLAFPTSSLRPTEERSVRDHNTLISFGYVVALAAGDAKRLSFLDWGGGVGVHYHLAKALVPGLELDYHVREIPQVCEVGRQLEPEVTFHEDDARLDRAYDVVMASSSLQYEERWQDALAKLATVTTSYLFLTRVPVVFRAPSHVVRHRASARGGKAEFLSWVVNREELVGCAERGGTALEREFLIGRSRRTPGAPERQEIRAFLFRAASARRADTVIPCGS